MKKILILIMAALMLVMSSALTLAISRDEVIQLYNQGKNDPELVKQLTLLLQQEPEDNEYNMIMGFTLTRMGQYQRAIPYLEKVNFVEDEGEGRQQKEWILYHLGQCYYAVGNYNQSKLCLEECIKLNVDAEITEHSKELYRLFGYDEYYKDWIVKTTRYFRFHFQPTISAEKINEIIADHETTFKQLCTFFGISGSGIFANVFIYNTREDFKVARDYFELRDTNVGVTYRKWFVIHAISDLDVCRHELTHIISYYYNKNSYNIYNLINEGIAVYFERNMPDFDLSSLLNAQVEALFASEEGSKVSIEELWKEQDGFALRKLYDIAGAFVQYLIDKEGQEKFRRLMLDHSFENAKKIYGERLEVLIKDFEQLLVDDELYEVTEVEIKNVRFNKEEKSLVVGLDCPLIQTVSKQFLTNSKDPNNKYDAEVQKAFLIFVKNLALFSTKVDTEFKVLDQHRKVVAILEPSDFNFREGNGSVTINLSFEMSDEDFNKLRPGMIYTLVPPPAKTDSKYRWIVGENMSFTIPEGSP